MHQTSNKGQGYQQPNLQAPCDKSYKLLFQDPTSKSR